MPTFPTLTPSSRTFTPGEYPHTYYGGMNGKHSTVRNSTVMLSSQLRLSFVALTEAEMLSILSHYQGQKGRYLSFAVPSDLFSGATATDYALTGYAWRYIEPPMVEDYGEQRHTVTVTLESVPGEGATAGGLFRRVFINLSAGAAFGAPSSPVASAANWQVVALFDGGAFANGVDVQTSRRDWLMKVTFTAGVAEGNLTVSPYWSDTSWQSNDILLF